MLCCRSGLNLFLRSSQQSENSNCQSLSSLVYTDRRTLVYADNIAAETQWMDHGCGHNKTGRN